MNEVPIVNIVVVSAQVGARGGISQYASPRTEITKMTTAQRTLKQMIQKLIQTKEDKLGCRLRASGQSSVGSFAHNLAVCFENSPTSKIDYSANMIVMDILNKPKDAQKDRGVVPGFEPGASRNFIS
jgi:hypothetical protein